MRSFTPGERFRLPSGQLVFTHIRLLAATCEDADQTEPGTEPGAESDVAYHVATDGGIYTTPLRKLGPATKGQIPRPDNTALTVDDLTPIDDD